MEQKLADPNQLENFPIAFFAMVMGLAGLTIAWEKIQHLNAWMVGITSSIFIVLALLYAGKFFYFRQSVLNELKHPVKLNFFPTLSVSLLLLATAFLPLNVTISSWLWMTGTALHLVLMLYVVNVWMHHEHFQVQHLNPTWFIPAVGNVLVPVAGVTHGYSELSWFFFSIGMLFWLVLLTIIFYRVLFHNPMEEKLMPTLFILIAPPAVGFIAYTRLVGELDGFGRILFYAGLFFTLLLFTQLRRFLKLEFFLSWWAYSFPMAAISIASMVMFELTGAEAYRWLGSVLLLLLTALIGLLLVRTGIAIKHHGICVPE